MSILDVNAPVPVPDDMALIKMIGQRFIARKDVKAMQHPDGAWMPVTANGKPDGERLPFALQDFRDHLSGARTYGHYLLNEASECKFFAYDIDLDKTGNYVVYDENILDNDWIDCNPREAWLTEGHPAREHLRIQLRCMAEGLALRIDKMTGLPVAVLDSGGKGLHVYCFMPEAKPAAVVRAMAQRIINHRDTFEAVRGENFYKHKFGQYPNITIEVFPKQDSLDGKDLGNLMALPLGVHRKSGRSRSFITLKNGYNQPWLPMDPMRAMGGDLPWE